MKKILLVFSILIVSICSSQEIKSEVKNVELVNSEISKIISQVYYEYKDSYNWKKAIFLINFKKTLKQYDFTLSILSETELNWLINNTKKVALGYFENEDIPVLVFGDASVFFNETNQLKTLDWLKKIPTPDDNQIKLPPLNIEPTVWCYCIEDGKEFKLIGINTCAIFYN